MEFGKLSNESIIFNEYIEKKKNNIKTKTGDTVYCFLVYIKLQLISITFDVNLPT